VSRPLATRAVELLQAIDLVASARDAEIPPRILAALTKRGLIEISPKGIVTLTPAGRDFLRAHYEKLHEVAIDLWRNTPKKKK
jgi:ribosomal protein S19E (S16A)